MIVNVSDFLEKIRAVQEKKKRTLEVCVIFNFITELRRDMRGSMCHMFNCIAELRRGIVRESKKKRRKKKNRWRAL